MLHGRVYVGTAEAVALGSARPSCLPAVPFLGGANRAASSAAGWAVTPAAPARLACPSAACAVVMALQRLAGEGCLDMCVISCGQCKPFP